MDIQVDRINTPQGELVFTITVSNPHLANFSEHDKNVMDILEDCKSDIEGVPSEESKVKLEVIGLIHAAKEKTFERVLKNLKFSIENEFRPKFQPICQEIYNWIYDKQTDMLKDWMTQFDPQRTTYYFDNDINLNKNNPTPQSEYDDDEDDEDEDGE